MARSDSPVPLRVDASNLERPSPIQRLETERPTVGGASAGELAGNLILRWRQGRSSPEKRSSPSYGSWSVPMRSGRRGDVVGEVQGSGTVSSSGDCSLEIAVAMVGVGRTCTRRSGDRKN